MNTTPSHDRELEIIDGIRAGLADVEAGHVVPHDEAMAEIDEVINTAEMISGKWGQS